MAKKRGSRVCAACGCGVRPRRVGPVSSSRLSGAAARVWVCVDTAVCVSESRSRPPRRAAGRSVHDTRGRARPGARGSGVRRVWCEPRDLWAQGCWWTTLSRGAAHRGHRADQSTAERMSAVQRAGSRALSRACASSLMRSAQRVAFEQDALPLDAAAHAELQQIRIVQ